MAVEQNTGVVSIPKQVECIKALLAHGADIHAKQVLEFSGYTIRGFSGTVGVTAFDKVVLEASLAVRHPDCFKHRDDNRARLFPTLLRGGAEYAHFGESILSGHTNLDGMSIFELHPYLKKVNDAGSFKAYEQLHLKRLVALLETKLPQIPKDVLSHVAYFWAHVGDY